MNKSTFIIGGGAAGIFAAIGAKISDGGNIAILPHLSLNEVTILEKMPRIGTKLSIAGGGRCNITHKVDDFDELIEYYPSGGKFIYSALSKFGPAETLDFFHSIGIKTIIDRGGRIFPEFEDAVKFVKILENYLRKLGIKIVLNCEVKEILKQNDNFLIKSKDGKSYTADKIILTTGGMSYPKTGSTGDGFNMAKKLGHKITPPLPSLVPLEVKEPWIKELQGLTLKNIEAKVLTEDKTFAGSRGAMNHSQAQIHGVALARAETREIASKFGDMLFTHFGLSGPVILYLSRQVVNLISEGKSVKVSIDLKPALSLEKLRQRLNREFLSGLKKQFKNVLANLLPQKMIPVFISLLKIKPDIQCSNITAMQRKNIINLLKNFEFTIKCDRGFYYAEVTQGGIDLNEVNPKTMESKVIKNIYFAGEVLDVDGYIGGFNLQAAFSTGFIAGQNACGG